MQWHSLPQSSFDALNPAHFSSPPPLRGVLLTCKDTPNGQGLDSWIAAREKDLAHHTGQLRVDLFEEKAAAKGGGVGDWTHCWVTAALWH